MQPGATIKLVKRLVDGVGQAIRVGDIVTDGGLTDSFVCFLVRSLTVLGAVLLSLAPRASFEIFRFPTTSTPGHLANVCYTIDEVEAE